jgi:hypothetical protein
MKTFKVLKKTEKTIQTKFGPKQKYSFQLDAGKGPFWCGAWKNDITSAWREGESYEMDVRPREYEGKQYFDVYTPKPQDEMLEILKRIEAKLDKFMNGSAELPPDISDPQGEPPDDSDIPF